MSCNGCRVLRKGCSETCILRTCLRWIDCPQAQGNATLFVAKFFGRSDLMSLISAVPEPQRPALFQSLLFEACGRTVNPVNGAVGLLSSGNWHVCQAAVETVLAGGVLRPLPGISAGVWTPNYDESSESLYEGACTVQSLYQQSKSYVMRDSNEKEASDLPPNFTSKGRNHFQGNRGLDTLLLYSEDSVLTSLESGGGDQKRREGEESKLLNLFV